MTRHRLGAAVIGWLVVWLPAATGQVDESARMLTGHAGPIHAVAFSPDGSIVASGAAYSNGPRGNETIQLWDVATGNPHDRAVLRGDFVNSVAFSPDGSILASAGHSDSSVDRDNPHIVRLWDIAAGQHVATLPHQTYVQSVAFSPNGLLLATGSGSIFGADDNTVRLWDVASTSNIAVLRGHDGPVTSVTFSPNGTRVASASSDGTVRLWDVASGRETMELRGHSDAVTSVAFNPTMPVLASGSSDETIRLWDVASGTTLTTLRQPRSPIGSVAFSPDGRLLAAACQDRRVRLYDAASGSEIAALRGHETVVTSVAFSPVDPILASGSGGTSFDEHAVRLWDVSESARPLPANRAPSFFDTETPRTHTVAAGDALTFAISAIDPDNDVLMYAAAALPRGASFDATARLFQWTPGLEQAGMRTAAFRAMDDAGGEGTLYVTITVVVDESLQTLVADPNEPVWSIALSPNGRTLASGGDDGPVRLWDVLTGEQLAGLDGHTDRVYDVAFSPDGSVLASGSRDGTARLWEGHTGAHLATLVGHSNSVLSVALSPDSSVVATASLDRTAQLWDAHTGEYIATLSGHTDRVTDVTFSPDGSVLATAADEPREARLWNAMTGELLHALTGASPAFSPDSSILATATGQVGSDIWLWDVRSGEHIDTLVGPGGSWMRVAFSPSGATLASAFWGGGQTWLWDVESGQHVGTLVGEGRFTFSPDGVMLAGAHRSQIRLWDGHTAAPLGVLTGHTNTVRDVVFAADGAVLASRSSDGTVRIWDISGVAVPNPGNRAPEFDPSSPRTIVISEGETRVVTVFATDPDSDLLTYSATSLPDGATFDPATRRVRWTPDFTASGSHDVAIRVTDGRTGEDTLKIQIAVVNTNRTPVFSAIADRFVEPGQVIEFSIAASDEDGDVLTYTGISLPEGAEFNPADRQFRWTPASTHVGNHLATFAAFDPDGGTGQLTVQIEVRGTTEPPDASVTLASSHASRDGVLYTARTEARFLLEVTDDLSGPGQINMRIRLASEANDDLYNAQYSESQEFVWTMADGDGEYPLAFTFTDAAGNATEKAVTVVLDTTPPNISASPSRVDTGTVHSPYDVETVVDDASPTTGVIHYRAGGRSDYQTASTRAPNQADDPTGETVFAATIPKGSMQYGVAYYLEFTDVVGNQATFPAAGAQGPASVLARGLFASAGPTPANMWAPVSVPLRTGADLRGVLGATDIRWAAGKPDGTPTTLPTVRTGESIWLFTETNVVPEFAGTTVDLVDIPRIQLTTGWNLVASPYLFPVPFGNLRAVAADGSDVPVHDKRVKSMVRPRFWQWVDTTADDRNDGHYRRITDFKAKWEPWSGYWLFADAPTQVFFEPFTMLEPGVLQSPVLPTPVWTGGVVLADSTGDSGVTLAVARETEDSYAALDTEQPPRMGALRLSLVQGRESFQQLARPSSADEWVWDAGLNAPGTAATIRLVDAPPEGHRLYLEDLTEGSRRELRPGYAIDAGTGVRQARLRLTRRSLGWDLADVTPSTTELLHNYPNPFNPETWIPFALSTESDVTIRIYDIAGSVVRSLALGRLPAGRYSQRNRAGYWDGRAATGESVASGIYVYELRAGEHRQTRRLVMRK
jgi:WD40 repeat protein